MEAQRHGGVGHRLGLGEAMHDAPYFARTLFPHDGQRIFRSLARMDHEGLTALARSAYVGAKALALPLEIAAYAVVIEPGLADRDHPRVARQLDQARPIHCAAVLIVRVHA